jgi:hypothetical protein
MNLAMWRQDFFWMFLIYLTSASRYNVTAATQVVFLHVFLFCFCLQTVNSAGKNLTEAEEILKK